MFSIFVHLRDFNTDAEQALGCLDPDFRPEETVIFKEHAPVVEDKMKEKLQTCHQQVSSLTQNAKNAMYTADTLSLAHDLAQIGNVYKAIGKNEHAKKTEKVLHLKSQNTIGASIVADHMATNCAVHSGVLKDQISVCERVGGRKCLNQCFKIFRF